MRDWIKAWLVGGVVGAVCLTILLVVLISINITTSHAEKLDRIKACSHADDVTVCLKLNGR